MPYSKPVIPNLLSIDPSWSIQFAGLFAGEGFATIHATRVGTYHPRLGMTLRQDDNLVMQDIHEKLGGRLRLDTHGTNPQLRWEENSFTNCEHLSRYLLKHWVLPTKKRKDVEIVLEFILWRKEQPFHKPDWSVGLAFMQKVRDIRVFKVPDNG